MAASVPAAVRLRLEQALGQWRHWQTPVPLPAAPVVLTALGQGLSNHSFLVASGEARFVLRLDRSSPASSGLNRQLEWRILQQAHAAGLAPAPRYFNPALGAMVCDYLPPDGTPVEDPAAIASLLRRIHALPPVHQRLDIAERCRRNEQLLRQLDPAAWQGLRPLGQQLAPLLLTLRQQESALVLCHNDLLRANRLGTGGRLWAVDWEYAAMGPAWFDLAAVIGGDEYSEASALALLEAYLQRPPWRGERQRLLTFECAYRYLELLWYHLAPQPDTALLGRKQTTLVLRLQALTAR